MHTLSKGQKIERAWLAAIVDSSQDAMIQWSADMTIVFWNRAAERLFGYAADEMLGRTPEFLSSPLFAFGLLDRLVRGESTASFETVRRTRGGRAVAVAVTISAIRDDAGVLLGFADIERDITDRRQTERALREQERLLCEQRRQLDDAGRREGDLLAALSHELRNPLASLTNTINVLCNGGWDGTADARRALNLIRRQTERLAHLVNDLLDISRITRGTLALQLSRVDVNQAVDEAVYETRWLSEQRKVTLRVTHSENPVWIDADSTRLVQIFNGLIASAVKNIGECGRLYVTIEQRHGEVAVRIRDNDGVSSPDRPYFFQAPPQSAATAHARNDAFPVSLALLRRLVELHGGQIHAANGGPGKGSEFVVQLPSAAV